MRYIFEKYHYIHVLNKYNFYKIQTISIILRLIKTQIFRMKFSLTMTKFLEKIIVRLISKRYLPNRFFVKNEVMPVSYNYYICL